MRLLLRWRANLDLQVALAQSRALETARAESEERLRSLIQANPAGVVVVECSEKRVVEANPAALEMIGAPREVVVGSCCGDFLCAQPDQTCPVLEQGATVLQAERRLRSGAGELVSILKSVTRISIDGRPHLIETFLDLREIRQAEDSRKQLSERLAEARRMESLGPLAGGVAHDLNNALGPLVTLPEIVAEGVRAMASGQEQQVEGLLQDLRTMKNAAQRAAHTIEDLSTLSRRGRMLTAPLDLNELVRSWVSEDAGAVLGGATLVVELEPAVITVQASRAHLARALNNLARNAADAVGPAGTVEVRTCVSGDFVELSVQDDGPGIPPADIPRVVEPFFSSKSVTASSGTGLGLTVVRGVAEDHHGRLEISSPEGQGALFTLVLPLARDLEPQPTQEEELQLGTGRVLVIDDEQGPRRAAQRALTRLGHEVVTADSGPEGLQTYEEALQGGTPFALVLLDMVMEGMDGAEVLEGIRALRSDQPVLVVSGFAPPAGEEHPLLPRVGWLAKPYGLGALSAAIAAELERTH